MALRQLQAELPNHFNSHEPGDPAHLVVEVLQAAAQLTAALRSERTRISADVAPDTAKILADARTEASRIVSDAEQKAAMIASDPRRGLSKDDCREMVLALGIAIAHEHQVVERLEADKEFRGLAGVKESTKERWEQLERFERLREKLRN